ncbi:MAG: hypothetical protein AAF679_15000 [Pseudomonadota bacterium]
MAIDSFKHTSLSLDSPAKNAGPVTASDSADLAYTSRALFVGTPGDLTVRMAGATETVQFKNLPICILPIRVDRVMATGTTAGDMVALW